MLSAKYFLFKTFVFKIYLNIVTNITKYPNKNIKNNLETKLESLPNDTIENTIRKVIRHDNISRLLSCQKGFFKVYKSDYKIYIKI